MATLSDYTSDQLFHFVGHKNPTDHEANFTTLCRILRAGCVSHSPHDNNWGKTKVTIQLDRSLLHEELIVPEVTCFCDIRHDHLSFHMKKYGYFGLSFPRDYLVYYGARPVMYVPLHQADTLSVNGASLLNNITSAYRAYRELVVKPLTKELPRERRVEAIPQSAEAAIDTIDTVITKDLLAYLKPFDSELPHDDPSNFYMEREWRKHGNLKFHPDNVQKVVVSKGFGDKLAHTFPGYAEKVLEVQPSSHYRG